MKKYLLISETISIKHNKKEKIKQIVDLESIDFEKFDEFIERVSLAQITAHEWVKCFLAIKSSLENEPKAPRWDFDRNVVISNAEHVARICKDVSIISNVFKFSYLRAARSIGHFFFKFYCYFGGCFNFFSLPSYCEELK